MLADAKQQLEELSSRQKVLAEAIDPKQQTTLLDFYVRIAPRLLNAERCSIFIHDPQNKKVWLKTGTGVTERGIEVSVKDSVVGEVITTGKAVIARDLESRDGTHKKVDTTTGFVSREIICVPIRSKDGGRITGAIQVLNKKSGAGFNEEDQAFLEEMGNHFQSIVESVYLGQQALGVSRSLVATASRAIYGSLIAVAASLFIAVFAAIYGGLPLWFK